MSKGLIMSNVQVTEGEFELQLQRLSTEELYLLKNAKDYVSNNT